MKKTLFVLLILISILLTTGCGTTQPGEDEYNKGIEANNAEKIDLAQRLFKQAIQKNPNMAEAYINLGMVYIKQHDDEQAWEATQTGLNLILKNHDTIIRGDSWETQAALAYNNLAKIVFDKAIQAHKLKDLSKQQQYRDEALGYLQQALELAPENELIITNTKYIKQWLN
jgi:tetratricopeptide (TPR) repeat protein